MSSSNLSDVICIQLLFGLAEREKEREEGCGGAHKNRIWNEGREGPGKNTAVGGGGGF